MAGSVGCSYFEPDIHLDHLQAYIRQPSTHLETMKIPSMQDHLLSSTWMSFLLLGGFIQANKSRYPSRFNVAWTMDCTFIGLKCDRPTFIYFVLALGASPDDECLRSLLGDAGERRRRPVADHIVLETNNSSISVTSSSSIVARLPAQPLAFSWRRALAWELVMIPVHGNTTIPIPLISGKPLIEEENEYVSNPLGLELCSQREFYNAPDQLAASLTWILYVEEVYSNHNETLPVPPQVLASSKAAFDDLKQLTESEFVQLSEAVFSHNSDRGKHTLRVMGDGLGRFNEWNQIGLKSIILETATWDALYKSYGPHVPAQNRQTLFGIRHEQGFIARLFLALSPIVNWKSRDWAESMTVTGESLLKSPMGILFKGLDPSTNSSLYFG